MDLSIIILNYKSQGLLKQCLRHIDRLTIESEFEVIVVDNASDDGTGQMLANQFPSVRFIQSDTNLGYGGGMNLGLKRATGRYQLILNPDIAILTNELEAMMRYMDEHQDIGILGPKLINPDSSLQYTCYRFPSFLMPIYRRTVLGKIPWIKRKVEDYLMTWWDHKTPRDVDWLLGGCLLCRKSVLDTISLFDDRFFMYFEDVDLARRCWQAGYRVVYFPFAEIVHYHQRSSAERGWVSSLFSRITREHIKSWLKYFMKYAGTTYPSRPHDQQS